MKYNLCGRRDEANALIGLSDIASTPKRKLLSAKTTSGNVPMLGRAFYALADRAACYLPIIALQLRLTKRLR